MSGVAFADPSVPQAVADLQVRSLGSDEDREAWLAARTDCVTATEAKLLIQAQNATARARVVADLIDEKVNGSKFAGNHFTEWGKLREPVILAELERRYGIRGCGLLVHAEGNSRHAATPDGAGVDFDGLLVLAEIKTSKNDVSFGTAKFERAGYYFQMQWQMYCTGAQRVLYVVERHNDDWSGWDLDDRSTWLLATGPKPAPLEVAWVARDDRTIARMVHFADEALAALDAARAVPATAPEAVGDFPETAERAELGRLVARVVSARAAEKFAVGEKSAAWSGLLALGAERGDFAEKFDEGSVRYVAAVAEDVEVTDVDAARAAHPQEWAALEELEAAAASARAAWDELAAGFKKTESRPGKPSLTVTAARAKKGTK